MASEENNRKNQRTHASPKSLNWYKVLDLEELPEGRVKPVTAGVTTLAITHFQGQYGALNNKCPHQGGP